MVVGERGLRASLMRALRAVAGATLSRFARLEPPAEVLILINDGRKKTCFKKQVFRMVVGERGLRASLMRALRAVAKATLSRFARLEPPAEVLILINCRRKKTCFKKQVFRMVVGERGFEPPTHWSQTSCATKLRYSPMRGASYCWRL